MGSALLCEYMFAFPIVSPVHLLWSVEKPTRPALACGWYLGTAGLGSPMVGTHAASRAGGCCGRHGRRKPGAALSWFPTGLGTSRRFHPTEEVGPKLMGQKSSRTPLPEP